MLAYEENADLYPLAFFAFDAVWALARALNDTLNGEVSDAVYVQCGCSGTVEDVLMSGNDTVISCLLYKSLQNISTTGITVSYNCSIIIICINYSPVI